MTDTTPTTPDDADQQQAPPADSQDPPKQGSSAANAEAAKYRARLRETEAERDTLLGTVQTYRRREVEQAAEAAGMARGADLFDAGHELGDLLGEDGTVDVAKVQAAAARLLEERPHWAAVRPRPRPDNAQGQRVQKPSSDWTQVLSGRDR